MKEYFRTYAYQWFMEDWEINYTDYIKEAYDESLKYYGDFITGQKPFRVVHHFQMSYVLRSVKRLIRKVFPNI